MSKIMQLTPDGDLVAAPEPDETRFDAYANLPEDTLLEMEKSAPDSDTKWQIAKTRIRKKHLPKPPADIHDVLPAMPQIARINEIAHEAMARPEQKMKALAHADGFKHEEEGEAERARVNNEELTWAVERLEEFEDLAHQAQSLGRPGKTTDTTRNVASLVQVALKGMTQTDAVVLLNGIAREHPTEWAAVGAPQVRKEIVKPNPNWKGVTHLLEGVFDRNPTVDVYRLQQDMADHISVARQVVTGLLTAVVREDGRERPTGSGK